MPTQNFFKVSASPEFTDALRLYCSTHGISISAFVRLTVREYWKRHREDKVDAANLSVDSNSSSIPLDVTVKAAKRISSWGK